MYDHRLKQAIVETGDPDLFPDLSIPESTTRTWMRRGVAEVISFDSADADVIALRATIGRLRKLASTTERMRIRVHDLRGTFVTVKLAIGRSESWISDRTGHRSSAMIARYKRTTRSFSELDVGDLAPMDWAIPELCLPRECPAGVPQKEEGSEIIRDLGALVASSAASPRGTHTLGSREMVERITIAAQPIAVLA